MTYRQPTVGLCVGRHRHEPERPRRAVEGYLCVGCFHNLKRALADIGDLAEDLERALINGDSGRGAKVSGSPTRPLPYNDEASTARLTLLDVLSSWTRLIAEERGENLPTDLSPRGQAEWQGYRLAVWTAGQEWIDEYATNLLDAVSDGRRVLAGSRSRLLTLGACTGHISCDVQTQEHQPCPGKVKARVDLVDEMLPSAVACTDCGQVHTARELPALGKAMTGGVAWVTSAQAARMLGVAVSRVRAIAAGRDGEDGQPVHAPWRRRDKEGIRPSRWNLDDVEAEMKRRNEEKETA